jgi:sugar O-acyltransferase (sialic acid O-acetyltransferase NeuD family)
LVIVGAGGHGREVLDIVEAVNAVRPAWRFLGFLDDGTPDADRLARRGAVHLGDTAMLRDLDADYVVGIGDGDTRRRVAEAAGDRAAAVLVHPLASCGADVELAPGVMVAAGARITTNVRIGRHTHVNCNALVSHDCRLGEFVTLSPGVLVNGTVTLDDGVLLGTGAIVTPGRTVGRGTWVGAGAVVVDDLPAGVVATGVPARVRRER